MIQQLTFAVEGPPKPKDRPRFSGHAYTTKRTRDYEKAVRLSAMKQLATWRLENGHAHWNARGPYSVSITFFMGDKRPRDLDNCVKSITDAVNGLLYDDDAQIDELYAFRDYDPRSPRAVVTVRRLREGP